MNDSSLVQAFINRSCAEKVSLLLRLAHELTVIARDTYDRESDGLTNPVRTRTINEVQHRVLSFLISLRENNINRYPDDVLVGIIVDHPEDIELQRQLQEVLSRLVSQVAAA
jgi:hypothetical protein